MSRLFLLVDDDREDAELFAEALENTKQEIDFDHVDSGENMLDYLNHQEHMPDIIFLDLNMPKMNGWQCLDFLKRHHAFRKIPVLIYSTSDSDSDKFHARKAGAHGYLVKPGSFRQLESQLKKISSSQEAELDRLQRQL